MDKSFSSSLSRVAAVMRRRSSLALLLLAPLLAGCFTGVEGTKKIELSRSDLKAVALTPEEKLMDSVSPLPLVGWERGHLFYVADDKAAYALEAERSANPDSLKMKGKRLRYVGRETRRAMDGRPVAVLVFSDGADRYRYDTRLTPEEADTAFLSDRLPMMIDISMVERADSLLRGRELWTRTSLWYTEEGNRRDGFRYVPVRISDVAVGSSLFPLRVRFLDGEGRPAWIYMNFGHGGKDSRSLANLFSLTDIKKRYPQIDNEVWRLIQQGKLRAGMTKEECRLSVGNPTDVNSGHDWSRTLDLWQYADGKYLRFADGLLIDYRM